jgi:DNA-binding IclR family transcriptional regulator
MSSAQEGKRPYNRYFLYKTSSKFMQMPRRPTRTQQGIQSIEVGGRLLQALASSAEPMMLRDLAGVAHMPAAKAHRYLVSFIRMGLIEQNLATARYDLGEFALTLGLSALARLEPVTVAVDALPELARETGHSVAVAIWGNHGPTIVHSQGSQAPASASLRTGLVLPLTHSATGRIFLSFMPDDATRLLLKRELASNVRHGWQPATMRAITRITQKTKRNGYAMISDLVPGLSTMAAPVFHHNGELALALVSLGYSKPFDNAAEKISAALVRTANALSKRLGQRA